MGSLRQWVHLNQLFQLATSQLLKYDILVRTRTDIVFSDVFSYAQLRVPVKGVYAQTDYFYYAAAPVFMRVFADMLKLSLRNYSSCDAKACVGSMKKSESYVEGGCKIYGTRSCPTWMWPPLCM